MFIIFPSCVNNGIFNPNQTIFSLFYNYETNCMWLDSLRVYVHNFVM